MKQKLFTKNFTMLVLGQVSSLFGNYILKFALSMYVLEVTGSAAIFAGLLAVATVPTILLSPFGGIMADRLNRKNIMVALDTLTGLSILCATLLFNERIDIGIIGGLLVVLSVLGAFESPTVQACVPQMQSGDNIIRANAVVNQVAAVAGMIAPVIGSILYVGFGLRNVMAASIMCFFLTAILECFIQLEHVPVKRQGSIFTTIKNDFVVSMSFIGREQPGILKILLLSAMVSFFVMGTAMVGLPFIIRNVLGLNPEFYGAAESAIGFSAIVGSLAAGLLTGKLRVGNLSIVLVFLGLSVIPAGVVFLTSSGTLVKYVVVLLAFCGMQIAACIFSVFGLSDIQQKTPPELTGKVMAYAAAIGMIAQPLGQSVYGLLFDGLSRSIYLILMPTGVIICLIGLMTVNFFHRIDGENVLAAPA